MIFSLAGLVPMYMRLWLSVRLLVGQYWPSRGHLHPVLGVPVLLLLLLYYFYLTCLKCGEKGENNMMDTIKDTIIVVFFYL